MITAFPTDKKRLVEVVPTQDVEGKIIWANVFVGETYVKTVNNVIPSLTQTFVSVIVENLSDVTRFFTIEVRGRHLNSMSWETISDWLVEVPALDTPQVVSREYLRGDYRDVQAAISGIGSELNIQEYYLSTSDISPDDGLVIGGQAGEPVVIPCDFTGMSPSSQYSIVFDAEDVGVVGRDRLLLNGEDGYPTETDLDDIVVFDRPVPEDPDDGQTLDAPVIGTISRTSSTAQVPFTEVEGAAGYEYIVNDEEILTADNNPIGLTDVEAETEYVVRVRAVAGDVQSPWSQPKTFTTEAAPIIAPASAPVIGDIETETDSARVFYSGVSGAEGYNYRINGGQAVSLGSVNPFLIVGLSDYETFLLEMQAFSAAGTGPWGAAELFTTDALLPQSAPVISSVETTDSQLTVSFSAVPKTDSYQVSVDGGDPIAVAGSPAVISDLAPGDSGSVRVRAVNPAGEGEWSDPVAFLMKQPPQDAPVLTNIDELPDEILVTRTGVDGATGYEYRLNAESASIVDVGSDNPFAVTGLTPETTHNQEARAYNEWGNGPWSEVAVITAPENISPVIGDPSLDVTVTDSQYNVSFDGATDNKPDSDLQYILVEGVAADLEDEQAIQQLTAVALGTDINQFTVHRSQGFSSEINIYVKDGAGNISLYEPTAIFLLDPEIIGIEVEPGSIEGIVGETGSISWTIQSNVDTTPEQELATPESSNTDRLVLSNIDKQAGTADYELLQSGIGTIDIVSDFDGTTVEIPFEVSEFQVVDGSQSNTNFDVIA